MKNVALVIAALTLSSTMGFAKSLAKMELICVANEDQNVIRTVYLTSDNTPLIANPLGSLLIVDTVQQPTNESFVLNAGSDEGSEVLTVKKTGEGDLVVTAKTSTTKFTLKCYANGILKGLSLN
jgi:hypothetical protein